MGTIIAFPLLDGPLTAPTEKERPDLVFRMAADLLETNTFGNHHDAFVTLVLRGHRSFLVARFIDDARQRAMQALVAAEMSEES
jgi:hypothetical protein